MHLSCLSCMSSRNPKPKIQSTNPLGEDGIVRCHHGEEAARRTARTSQHPNRDFYCCARPPTDTNRCRFWYWADDPMFKMKNVPSARDSVSTPGSSRPEAAQSASTSKISGRTTSKFHPAPSGPETPTKRPETQGRGKYVEDIRTVQRTSPQKRGPSSITETPGRDQRFQDIEAGLQARDGNACTQVQASPSIAFTAEASSGWGHAQAEAIPEPSQPRPPSQASTEVDWDNQLPPATPTRKKYSFLGLDPSPESTPSILPEPTSPVMPQSLTPSHSPKKRRLSVTEDHGGSLLLQGEGSTVGRTSMLLTPPQTTHRPNAHEEDNDSRPQPVTPTRHKGKERSNGLQGGLVIDDEDNPFRVAAGPRNRQPRGEDADDVLPQLRSGASSGSTSSASLTPGEQVAANLDSIKEPIRALQSYIDSLEKLQAGKYIQKLERQRKALELGNEVKKKKIAELMTELDDLREKLRRSEESNRAKEAEITHLKARRPL